MADGPRYLADPGGIFDSDTHRRVLAHILEPGEEPISVENLLARMLSDGPTQFTDIEELRQVCDELVDDGDAERVEGDYLMTSQGLQKLNDPLPNEPPPLEGEALEAAEQANQEMREEEEKLEEEGSGHE